MHTQSRLVPNCFRPLLVAGILSALAACDTSVAPTGHAAVSSTASAKWQDRRIASYYWAAGSQYGIQPDGRVPQSVDGVATSEYRQGDCGVRSGINLTNGGDSFHNPDETYRSSVRCSDGIKAARYESLVYPAALGWAPEQIASMYIRRLYFFDNGSSDPVYVNWRNTMDIQTTGGCGQLWFNEYKYPGSSNVLITRTTVNGHAAFRVESDSTRGHLAWCVNRNTAVSLPFVVYVEDLGPA